MAPSISMGEDFGWGEVTSTIDWCEHNYTHTEWIAEFWNTLSSFCIILSGAFNMYQSIRFGYEWRMLLMSLSIFIIGFGSVLFHATLKYEMQLLDELPMIYFMFIWMFTWFELSYKEIKRRWLVPGLIIGALFVTVVHAGVGFVFVFHVFFAMMSTVGYGYVFYFIFTTADKVGIALGVGYLSVSSFALLLWWLDQRFCTQLHDTFNPQLHAIWHALIGVATYVSIPLVCYARQLQLKTAPSVRFNVLALPYIQYKRHTA
eukprot:m.77278 g.77278  ORF g.77278 m.77278 type:complete len:260 (-) comp24996_c0_seq1:119-898(-)